MLGSIMVRSSVFVEDDKLSEIMRMLEHKTITSRISEYETWSNTKRTKVEVSISGIIGTTYIHIDIDRDIDNETKKLKYKQNRVVALIVLDIQKKPVMTRKELLIYTMLKDGTRLIRPM